MQKESLILKKLYAAFQAGDATKHASLLCWLIRQGSQEVMPTIRGHVLADDWLDFCQQSLNEFWAQRQGALYVVGNPVTPEFFKVGKTGQDVQNRLRQLNNEAVIGTQVLVQSWLVHDRHYLERAAHASLGDLYRHKEFFHTDWRTLCPRIADVIQQDIQAFQRAGFEVPNWAGTEYH